ncbi:putative rRNA maturation factor [Sulfurirhabdus autotrophica]|uniref:Endoribonuclease YbeY n=2 Tax=Sulfurirhabdus autotrophica TaxID=1706046 RepID=A0A4R3XZY1_9PROT|nr:rRNA maturation RNase YbeY [Sulfurirhabdus autotrophica]TCV84712.1 putative rRNA maturation factor [Sulfurirhabdus autotrophica]
MSVGHKKTPNKQLHLSVQYAVQPEDAPSRPQIRKWVKSALKRDADMTVRLVDEAEGRELNREYRGKDYATNVLTFVYDDLDLPVEIPLSGDLVLCAPVVAREASEQGISIEAHYAHLIVHGVLHLQGYDHEDEAEAEEMEALESEIIVKLGYVDPYGSEK